MPDARWFVVVFEVVGPDGALMATGEGSLNAKHHAAAWDVIEAMACRRHPELIAQRFNWIRATLAPAQHGATAIVRVRMVGEVGDEH